MEGISIIIKRQGSVSVAGLSISFVFLSFQLVVVIGIAVATKGFSGIRYFETSFYRETSCRLRYWHSKYFSEKHHLRIQNTLRRERLFETTHWTIYFYLSEFDYRFFNCILSNVLSESEYLNECQIRFVSFSEYRSRQSLSFFLLFAFRPILMFGYLSA